MGRRLALALGGALVVACGGGVSLGVAGGDLGADGGGGTGGGSGDAAPNDCSDPNACGPQPAIATCGGAAKCTPTSKGCQWIFPPCPPQPACFDPDGTLDPSYRKCATPSDCMVVTIQKDCCGTQLATGVAIATAKDVMACSADKWKGQPACACPMAQTTADDGTISNGGAAATATCGTNGQCESTFESAPCAAAALPPCPAECPTFPMTGPCASTGQVCRMKGSKLGDECKCDVAAGWTCSTHPPLGPGCNVVCK
jgi:hypothetical protein